MESIAATAVKEAPTATGHDGPPIERPDFQVVPVKALPAIAVAFAFLIWAVSSNRLWPVTFIHVAFGAAWTIIDLFLGFVLGPIMGKMSIPARIEFTTRLMPKMVVIMPTIVTMTLVGGWQLGVLTGNVYSGSPNHGWIVASYIVVGIMAVIALGLLEPANIGVLVELKKPRPNPAVIERLMKRFMYTAAITGAMQVATLVIMTKVASG